MMVVGLLVSMIGAAAAAPQTLTIYGANGTAGETDPYTDYSMDGGATWHPAYLYGWHPWGFVPGTNSWINCAPNGEAPECLNRTVMYRIRFTIPAGSSNPEMIFDVKADNYAAIAVNGTHVADITGQGGTTADATIAGALHAGVNEISLDVLDEGGWGGMNYKITLNIDAPTPPTLGVPTIVASGNAVAVSAGSAGIVDAGISLRGFETIDGASVTINNGFVPSEDQLTFTNQNGIVGTYNNSTGVLTLSGSASAATYQAALQNVTFANTNPNSNQLGPRTVTFSVGAGTLFNAATGHFYQYVASPGVSWTAARDAAAGSSLYGLRGYLATMTSAAENSFVTAKLAGTGWIGGSDAAQEGVWQWVTGPEAGTVFSSQSKLWWNTCSANTGSAVNGQYVNWQAGEPNDCGSYAPGNHAEDFAHFYTSGTWNDYPGNAGVEGYVVEYGGMPGDSQPVLSANATVNVVDRTPPVITGAPTAPANSNGWYNSDVTVHFTCTDTGSGIATCGPDQTVSQQGANQSATGSAVDNAGNTASATVSAINVDKAAPMTTIAAPTTGQNQDVPVTLSATDNLSGVAATYYTVDGGAQQSGTSFTLAAEGIHTITYWSVDAAGNAEAAQTATVQIDKTAPTITGAPDRAANGAGWYNADVTVSFTCSDDQSGVASCSGPQTLGEGASQSATGSAADNAGNTASATVSGINVDKAPPMTTIAAPTTEQNQDVPVTLSATDNLSGVADTYYTVDGGAQQSGTSFTLSTEGIHTITYWSVDAAGNAEAAQTATVQIDKTAPTITGAPDRAANSAGWYNADVTVSFTCSDDQSGVASCSGPQTLGEGASQSATGSAADNAGNTASATVSGINVDQTAPTVTYSGNAGTYSIDQQVAISCTAEDSLSGVASSTCATVSGPAYGFALGVNTYSATATDNAGNATTNTVSFAVSVSNVSLCSLTQQFVGNKGIANSLCVKLENAAKQAAAGETQPANNMLKAFIDEVEAQTGKALTVDKAAVLTRLAEALSY
jgi:hypothetical protein